jgi:hypothetical protein
MWRMLAALAFFGLAVRAQDATGAIEGVLTDSAAKLPVLGAQISITPEDTAADVFTDASGGFRFSNLAPGRYGIRAKHEGYREAFRFVQVKDGGSAEQIALKMTPFSEIAGQVLDEDRHPIAGVGIYTGTSLRARTDAEGRYQITELAPGTYRLYCRILFATREALVEHDKNTGEARGYADTYYFPGVDDPARAANTSVAAGVHIGGFDFHLKRGPLVEYSGRVVDINREPLSTAAVQLVPQNLSLTDETRDRRRVKKDGSFRFELIPPGHYTLVVFREGGVNMASRPYRMPVEVGPGGVTDAELKIPRSVDVTVSIVVPHPEKTQGLVHVNLGSVFADSIQISMSTLPLCQLGEACVVADVPPGQWAFAVTGAMAETGDPPHKLYLESVRLGQQNASGAAVTVAEAGNPPLELTFTDKAGSLSAAVSTEDGQPADAAIILARKADAEGPPFFTQRVQREPDGRFVVDGMVAGEYKVAAFVAADDQDSIRTWPIERCGDRVARVTVTAGQTTNVALKPCMPE